MPAIRKINVPGVARLPAFCHATVAGEQVFVSGMLGAREGALELVPGGVAAQTTQALRHIETLSVYCPVFTVQWRGCPPPPGRPGPDRSRWR
jgi:hypothetical protein